MENILSSECYIRETFRLYCPGCGGTRAVLALLGGDILQSARYNPIVLLLLLDVIFTVGSRLLEKKCKNISRIIKFRIWYHLAFLVFIGVFFLWRNYLLYVEGIDMLGDFY
ncbi:MAG: DUF2752 domain-containing protein [Lachnospiraceae bacterium]|nr:DUF2752 domain-containing protein [Lachnospiraceae bacterium]